MRTILTFLIAIIGTALLAQQAPKGDPKPAVNPTTGARMPDTTNYSRARGTEKTLFKRKAPRRRGDPVAPSMDTTRRP